VRDVLEDVLVVPASEGRLAAEKNLHAHSQGPNVAFFVITPPQYFWGDLVGCPLDALLFLVLDLVRQPEIDQFHVGA